jgi:hypothetical protein
MKHAPLDLASCYKYHLLLIGMTMKTVALSVSDSGIDHRELLGTCRGWMANPTASYPICVSGWMVCGHPEMTIHDVFLFLKNRR